MRAVRVAAAVAAMASVGCDRTGQGDNSIQASLTNYQQEVIDLPDNARNAVFLRAIRDAGLPCQHVPSSERLADEKTGPAWRARCQDGSNHMIVVQADGEAQVVTRIR